MIFEWESIEEVFGHLKNIHVDLIAPFFRPTAVSYIFHAKE
jgi:hypothetical protein